MICYAEFYAVYYPTGWILFLKWFLQYFRIWYFVPSLAVSISFLHAFWLILFYSFLDALCLTRIVCLQIREYMQLFSRAILHYVIFR